MEGEGSLTLAERSRLAALRVEKRRADFLLGRLTAKAVATAALREGAPGDWPPSAVEILAEPGGAPYARLAPEAAAAAGFSPGERLPICVTISHAEGHALCAAAWRGPPAAPPLLSLGIDLGWVEPRSPALQATFFTDPEQAWIHAAPAGLADLRANLVWCAKEAALKALGLGLTVDTRALTCLPEDALADPAEWPLHPREGSWRRFTAACAPALVPGGAELRGVWRALGGFVGALAVTPAPPGAGAGHLPLAGP